MNLQKIMLNFSIICEYNPFHYGHLCQIEHIRREFPDSSITALMSGSFVQRGEAAMYGKYERAEAAVKCGVDLVLELPYPWCAGSGEFFASGGVTLLDGLGIFDRICFGSESGDIVNLNRMAENSINEAFDRKVAEEAKRGTDESYIRLRQRLYEEIYGEPFVTSPNDILGVEYLKALKKLSSSIEPYVIKRESDFSATVSRRMIRDGNTDTLKNMIPSQMLDIVNGFEYADMRYAFPAVLYRLRNADAFGLETLADIPNGMGRRLIEAANKSKALDELLENCAGKRFTDARIRRMLLFAMTDVTLEHLRAKPAYTTVLALNDRGARLLADIKARRKNAAEGEYMPLVITKPSAASKLNGEAAVQYELNKRAEILRSLCYNVPKSALEHLTRTPYIHKKEGENIGRQKLD